MAEGTLTGGATREQGLRGVGGPPMPGMAGAGFGDYLGIFRRRKWWMLLPLIVCVLLGGAICVFVPPRYQATTRVKVIDRAVSGALTTDLTIQIPHKDKLVPMNEEIKRRSFILPIIQDLRMSEGMPDRTEAEVSALIDRIKDNLEVNLVPRKSGDDFFRIRYTGRDPEKVARFVNAVREKYESEFQQSWADDARSVYEELKKRRRAAQQAREKAAQDLQTFRKENALDRVSGDKGIRDELRSLEIRLPQIRILIDARLRAKTALVDRRSGLDPRSVSAGAKKPNPVYRDLQLQLVEAERALATTTWRPTTARYRRMRDVVKLLSEKLARTPEFLEEDAVTVVNEEFGRLQTAIEELDREIDVLESERTYTERRVPELRAVTDRLPALETIESEKRSELDATQVEFDRWSRALARAEATWVFLRSARGNLFVTLEDARPDRRPVFPKLWMFLSISAVAGLALGLGLALIKEFTSATFSTIDQVKVLGPPLLGEITPLLTARERGRQARSRGLFWAVIIALLLAAAAVHWAWFDESMRDRLPAVIRKAMDRLWGG